MGELLLKGSKQTNSAGDPYASFPKTEYWKWLKELEDGEEIVIEINCKRSLNQNKLLHKIVSIVSNYTGEEFDHTKAWLVCKFFGCTDFEKDGVVYNIPVSTSRLKKKDFADGLSALILWCEEQNIKVPNNDYLI